MMSINDTIGCVNHDCAKCKAQLAPVQEPEHCDPSATVYKLAEMVMSDCGHSSNNQRLLDRIAERIQRHIDATTPPAAQPAVPEGMKLVPVEALTRWRDAFAEELGAWDIDPPLHHVKTSHDEIEAVLNAAPEKV